MRMPLPALHDSRCTQPRPPWTQIGHVEGAPSSMVYARPIDETCIPEVNC